MKLVSRLVIAVLGLLFIAAVATSWVAEWMLEDQLLANGADRVEIDNVYLNPLTGYISLTGVKVFALGRRSLALEELSVDVALLDLMRRQIRFSNVSIRGLDLAVEQVGASLLVGIPLSSSSNSNSQPFFLNWHWAVDQLNVETSSLSYKDGANALNLTLTKLGLRDVQTWNRESPGHVSASAVLNLNASGAEPLSLAIESLDLDSDLGIFIDAEFGLMWHGDGALKMKAVSVEFDKPRMELQNESLDVLFSLSGWPHKTGAVEGLLDINARQFTLNHLDRSILAFATAQISRLKIASFEMMKWDGIRFDELTVAAAKETEKPLLLLRELKATNGSLKQLNRLRIDNVTVDGVDVRLSRNSQGQFEWPQFGWAQPEPTASDQSSNSGEISTAHGTGTAATESTSGQSSSGQSTSGQAQPFSWQVVEFQLTDNSQVTWVDQSVSPMVTHVISALSAHGKNIGSDGLVGGPSFQVQGKLNQFSTFKLLGVPGESEGTLQLTAQLNALELPDYSPYLKGGLGYQFKSGQLFLDAQAVSGGEALDGQVEVRLNNVHLQPYDQALIKRVSKQLAMPLDMTLNTLRDKKGDVVIAVPVHGSLSQPAFSFNDVARQVTLRALKTATISMIKHAIQPYGTAITAVQIVTKAGIRITTIKVQDIHFENHDPRIDTQGRLQLDKLAQLLTSKDKLRLNICAFTSEREIEIVAGISNEVDVPQSIASASASASALALASERSKSVKRYLNKERGIAGERLYLCQSQVDTKNGANPRVELSL